MVKSMKSVTHVKDLVADPSNRRKHNPRNIGMVVDALQSVGAARSIVIDENNVILAGNGVTEAAAEAGITKVRVIEANGQELIAVRRTGLTDEQKRSLAIYDNRTAELAEWDFDQLVADKDAGLSLQPFWTPEEEAALLADAEQDVTVTEDEVPEPPVAPITQAGDLWVLGEHRLLCGDSTKAEDVVRLMDGQKADLCFTSPPYGQQRDYTAEGKAKVADWDGLMRGVFGVLPMSDAGQVLVNLGLIHNDGEWVPYWSGWIEWMREQGWRRFGWYVLDQGPGLPGDWNGRLAPSHEFVFHFNKQSVRPQKTKDCKWAGEENHGSGLRRTDNEVSGYSHAGRLVQDKKIPDSVIRVMRHKARGIEVAHPAVFSVPFASEFISAWTGVLYEPFCGSGTTMIAAEQLGRKCYGMEISPQYCDVIVKRWETLTGKTAIREARAA